MAGRKNFTVLTNGAILNSKHQYTLLVLDCVSLCLWLLLIPVMLIVGNGFATAADPAHSITLPQLAIWGVLWIAMLSGIVGNVLQIRRYRRAMPFYWFRIVASLMFGVLSLFSALALGTEISGLVILALLTIGCGGYYWLIFRCLSGLNAEQ